MFQDSTIITRTVIFIIALMAATLIGLYFLFGHMNTIQLRNEGRSIATQVVAFRGWIASKGVVWVRDHETDYLGKYTCRGQDGQHDFFSKNPALATRQLSNRFNRLSRRATFRVTSSNYRNPDNRPGVFEDDAQLAFEKNPKLAEYYQNGAENFYYARPLIIKKGCLKCHGDPAKAPRVVVEKYGDLRGFGYKVGDVRGVISVKIPTKGMLKATLLDVGPWLAAWALAVLGLTIVFTKKTIVEPVRKMHMIFEKIVHGQRLGVEDSMYVAHDTRNEIGRLALAIQKLASKVARRQ